MKGIISNSCHGSLTANVFFGKAGVGKSTVASWSSTKPGLFDVGTVDAGTTTLGTWLSSSLVENEYCFFAESQFQPIESIDNIPALPGLNFCSNMTGHLAFFDTEGLDYKTELGENYDILTVLPHTLIAENVFLVVRDRLNPNEVKDLIDRLAEAAKKTEGTFTFRNGKLFGNLIIIVNKSQVKYIYNKPKMSMIIKHTFCKPINDMLLRISQDPMKQRYSPSPKIIHH